MDLCKRLCWLWVVPLPLLPPPLLPPPVLVSVRVLPCVLLCGGDFCCALLAAANAIDRLVLARAISSSTIACTVGLMLRWEWVVSSAVRCVPCVCVCGCVVVVVVGDGCEKVWLSV